MKHPKLIVAIVPARIFHRQPCTADFQVCCIAGFQTRERRAFSTPCRFGNRPYSRFGNLRYAGFARLRQPNCEISGLAFAAGLSARAEIKVTIGHNDNDNAAPGFKFINVPSPASGNAARQAKLTIVDGEADPNSGGLAKLNDGKLPDESDQPGENFFFNAGAAGGRIQMDLGSVINIRQINTYSWHPGSRGPQVYKLYASDGSSADFNAAPKRGTDPRTAAGSWSPPLIPGTKMTIPISLPPAAKPTCCWKRPSKPWRSPLNRMRRRG